MHNSMAWAASRASVLVRVLPLQGNSLSNEESPFGLVGLDCAYLLTTLHKHLMSQPRHIFDAVIHRHQQITVFLPLTACIQSVPENLFE